MPSKEATMPQVTSRDGTTIAFDKVGAGPAVIVVDGALGNRGAGWGSELAALLSRDLTVYTYDRRGRNESGDTLPYAVDREIEDIEALVDDAGGTAFVYGISSGAALALEAAARLGSKVRALALYEPPYNSAAIQGDGPDDYEPKLNRLLREGRRGDAVELFMTVVGAPPDVIASMRGTGAWLNMESVAPTLAYDAKCLNGANVPHDRAARIAVPTLVMSGSASMDFMGPSAREVAEAIPNARYRELPGQTHAVDSKVLAPILDEFFCAAGAIA
jgi:pimeloyl-ACP methyl ester carboxylesterase